MECQKCGWFKSKVFFTAARRETVERRRKCLRCDFEWLTIEHVAARTPPTRQALFLQLHSLRGTLDRVIENLGGAASELRGLHAVERPVKPHQLFRAPGIEGNIFR